MICVKCLESFERKVLGKSMVFLLFLGKPLWFPANKLLVVSFLTPPTLLCSLRLLKK